MEKLVSISGKTMPLYMKLMIGAMSVLLLGDSMRVYLTSAGGGVIFKFLVGAACLYSLGFQKEIYLCEEGIVKETKSFLSKNREVLPWSSINAVLFAYKKDNLLAMFEVSTTGWKVLFDKSQEAQLREIIGRNLPDINIEKI